jgi:hypothetical protein
MTPQKEDRRWAAFVVASAMVPLAGWEILIDSRALAPASPAEGAQTAARPAMAATLSE